MELWGNGVMNSLAQHSNTPSLQYFLDATFRGKRGWSDLTEEAKKQLQKWMQPMQHRSVAAAHRRPDISGEPASAWYTPSLDCHV